MVNVTSHRNIAGVGLCTLVSAGFFSCFLVSTIEYLSIFVMYTRTT